MFCIYTACSEPLAAGVSNGDVLAQFTGYPLATNLENVEKSGKLKVVMFNVCTYSDEKSAQRDANTARWL